MIDFAVFGIITVSYTSIHIIGWNFTFPTLVERSLWRAASLVLLGSACSYGLLLLLVTWQLPTFCRLFSVARANTATHLFERVHLIFQYLIAGSWIGSYGIARLYIIVEAFVGLRALPESAFQSVNWSNFFPHL